MLEAIEFPLNLAEAIGELLTADIKLPSFKKKKQVKVEHVSKPYFVCVQSSTESCVQPPLYPTVKAWQMADAIRHFDHFNEDLYTKLCQTKAEITKHSI